MKKTTRPNRQEIITFRTGGELVKALDTLAAKEHRTRANLIEWLLTQDTNIERPVSIIALAVSSLYAEIEHAGTADTAQSEFFRGHLAGAKFMLGELRGAVFKDIVLHEVRKRIKKPFPHTIPLAPDGNRYGWDSDADIDGP
ncbi:MAG TPA: hypothetical protein VMD75_00700 [Candidatus Binataceae bacterium]|nr:hypothetical protein [Candidatus Binataceae bacterium]